MEKRMGVSRLIHERPDIAGINERYSYVEQPSDRDIVHAEIVICEKSESRARH